eukprot:g17913.t2
MQGNSDPVAPTEAHARASHHHHHGHGQGSFSPSSSASSSPRVSTYIDHIMFENPSGRGTQGLAGAASTPAGATLKSPTSSESAPARVTDEDPDPYPLWRRPSTSTNAAKSPRRSSSSSMSSWSSWSSWLSAPSSSSSSSRALAPASSSSSLFPSPAPGATTNPVPTGAGGVRGARKTTPCQYPGCSRNAKYGELDEAPIACQAHKRAGQYTTNRHGELLQATRDGDAFRTSPNLTTSPPPATFASTDTARQRSSNGRGEIFSFRKAAEPSSSAPQGVKRKNRPRLTSNEYDGSSASKIPSCLFPGCDAQPLYGLKAAVRPVYCFSHKKGPMVLLDKKAPKLHDVGGASQIATAAVARNGIAGKLRSKTPAAAATPAAAGVGNHVSRAPPTADHMNAAKTARRGSKDDADPSDDGGDKPRTKKGRGNPQRSKGGHDVARQVVDLATTSDNERGATATDAVPPRPSGNRRLGGATGMAPSAEILLLQQAREAAKREAEARGGGRRARAPSRRALEAAGRMTDQGAQWMTQKKKEEQARAATELREQRKRYRAAGLKTGVVLEEFVVGTPEAVAVTGAAGSGDSGREGGGGGAGSTPVVAGWRKVSPAALSVPVKPAVAQEKAAHVAAAERS